MAKERENSKGLLPMAVGVSLSAFLLLTFLFPPVFALNDDVQLLEILSGVCSGTPDLHTVYMRAPLSFLLSMLYRILPDIPWFGIFICGCYIGTFLVLWTTVLRKMKKEFSFFGILIRLPVFLFISFLFFFLPYIRPHYTTLAACIGGTGIFLLLTAERESDRKQMIAAMLLLLLCDQIRSQVFFMISPFLLFAFLYQSVGSQDGEVSRPDRVWVKKQMKYPVIFIGAYLILFAADALAYRAPEWRAYRELNEARTRLYDYTLVWEGESAREYYEGIGLDETAIPLYVDYALLPDPEADTVRFNAMAAYEEPSRKVSGLQHFSNVLYDLRVRTLGLTGEDAPYNTALLILFSLIFLTGLIRAIKVRKKDSKAAGTEILRAAFCLVPILFHFTVYFWLLWRGRVPERVVVSLYIVTFLTYSGILIRGKLIGLDTEQNRFVCIVVLMLFCISAGIGIAGSIRKNTTAYREQIAVNMSDNVVYLYAALHPEELFVIDTFATVYRTGMLLDGGVPDTANTLPMGGWQYGSPLQGQKLKAYGYDGAEALFTSGGAYFVRRKDRGITAEELQLFLDRVYGTSAVRVEFYTVITGGEEIFEIYRLLGPEETDADGC